MDARRDSGTVFGISYSQSSTEVDGLGAGDVAHNFDTHLVSIYGDNAGDNGYAEFMLNLSLNENDTSRSVKTGGINRTIKGVYDSLQASVNISGGLPHQLSERAYITPMFGINASLMQSEAYTETGGTNLNLKLDPDDYVTATGTVGLKFHGLIDHNNVTHIPELRIGLGYDINDDAPSTKATYTGGGTSFTMNGVKDQEYATVGLGYTLSGESLSIGINADAQATENTLGGTGSAEIKIKF